MKKILTALCIIFLFVGYAAYAHSVQTPDAITSPTPTPAPAGSPLPQPAPVAEAPKGRYKDGTYTGSVADAYYGNVQVRVTISNGLISDVAFLQYPNDRGESRQISQVSLPRLRSEAIAAQSVHVDGVSGATQTSDAFIQSLQDALSQAA